MTLMQYCNIGL